MDCARIEEGGNVDASTDGDDGVERSKYAENMDGMPIGGSWGGRGR